MNKKIILIAVILIALFAVPVIVNAVEYDTVTCTYYWFPLNRYICNDGHNFRYEQDMINFYVPPLEQTEPDYTFVTGGQSEILSGQ